MDKLELWQFILLCTIGIIASSLILWPKIKDIRTMVVLHSMQVFIQIFIWGAYTESLFVVLTGFGLLVALCFSIEKIYKNY